MGDIGSQAARWAARGMAALLLAWGTRCSGMLVSGSAEPTTLAPLRQDITVTVRDNVARVVVVGAISVPARLSDASRFLLALPDCRGLASLVGTFGGKPLPIRQIEPKASAELCRSLVRATGNASLLAYFAHPLASALVDVSAASGQTSFEVRFEHPVPKCDNAWHLSVPLDVEWLCNGGPSRAEVLIDLETPRPLGVIWSPSHTASTLRVGPRRAMVCVPPDSPRFGPDLHLLYTTVPPDTPVSFYCASRRATEQDGHFSLLVAAPAAPVEIVGRDVTFVLDTSASMTGDRLTCARAMIGLLIRRLSADTRLNVLRFAEGAERLFPAPRPPVADTRRAAADFLSAASARGPTNLVDALVLALRNGPNSSRAHDIVLVTDGSANLAGQSGGVVRAVAKENKRRSRIFAASVGTDAHHELMKQIASATGGASVRVLRPEAPVSAEGAAASIASYMAPPALRGIRINVSDAELTEIVRIGETDLAGGAALEILGRYQKPGQVRFALSAEAGNERMQWEHLGQFGGRALPSLPLRARWGFMRARQLLVDVRTHQEGKEFLDRLATHAYRHRIATSYSYFLPMPALRNIGGPEVKQARTEKRFADRAEVNWQERGSAVSSLFRRGLLYLGAGLRTSSDLIDESAAATSLSSAKAKVDLKHSAATLVRPGQGDTPRVKPGALDLNDTDEGGLVEAKGEPDRKAGDEPVSQLAKLGRAIAVHRERGRFAETVLKHAAGRVFYQLGDTWVDEALRPDAEVVQIRFGSNAFFELFGRSPLCREVLPIGARLILAVREDLVLWVGPEGDEVLSDRDRARLLP